MRTTVQSLLKSPSDDFTLESFPEEIKALLPYASHLNLKKPQKLPVEGRDALCTACVVALEAIIDLFLIGASPDLLEEAALVVCDLFNIENHDVCKGAIHNYVPQFEYIFSQRRVTGREACAILLGNGCGASRSLTIRKYVE